jgi:hypothetical protein
MMVESGGHEYYMVYRKGNHELRKIINSDDDYEIVCTGHYEECMRKMDEIKAENFEYDYNL